ncbi:hypothetical protein [Streptomyces abikoensis]|uniref:Uncharacterized protein n=1 Tax=Streptomyces abikoensis TaxID=97398 RepID=A0ABW7T851_9ACTN
MTRTATRIATATQAATVTSNSTVVADWALRYFGPWWNATSITPVPDASVNADVHRAVATR